MSIAEDSIRRDALARSLCVRICDERLTIEVLAVVDRVLERLLDSEIPRDRFNEDEGDEIAQSYRRGWNHGARNERAKVLVEAGLREVADAPAIDLRLKHTLTGDVG